jgi:hypothetical protein
MPYNDSELSTQIDEKLQSGISDALRNRLSDLGLPLNWNIHQSGCIQYIHNNEPRNFDQDIRTLIYLLIDICPNQEISNEIAGDFVINFKTKEIHWHYNILMIKDGRISHHHYQFPDHTIIHNEYHIALDENLEPVKYGELQKNVQYHRMRICPECKNQIYQNEKHECKRNPMR